MPLLPEGYNILGTYEVERFLGEGAFAEVYRVRHRFLGRQCIDRGNVQGLRNVVAQLLGLLPREQADLMQRGYISGISK